MTSFVRADCPTQSKSPLFLHLLQLEDGQISALTDIAGQQGTIIMGGLLLITTIRPSQTTTTTNRYIELLRTKLEYSYTF